MVDIDITCIMKDSGFKFLKETPNSSSVFNFFECESVSLNFFGSRYVRSSQSGN